LAEVDDDTSGTESFYVNDAAASGLEERDELLSQYEAGNTEDCPLLTECDDEEFEDHKAVSSDVPAITSISICHLLFFLLCYVFEAEIMKW